MTFLSARVPDITKRRIKEIAARKGISIQNLVRQMVDDLIDQEGLSRLSLGEIISKLRDNRQNLETFGIVHVDIFGSVVRGEADNDSDIDIAVEFNQRDGMSLSRFASLQNEFENILKTKVDLCERQSLNQNVKQELDHDAIRVF